MNIPIDYETLRIIWWLLIGVLLIGFAIMDGFDLGIGILLPFVAKTDEERRITLHTIEAVWEGNQVWFIVAGAAIFAAWPTIYAVSFFGFYYAMLLGLLALILRPVGFKFRNKLPHARWRSSWDKALFIAGFVPALIFGVALGNVIQGIPFYFDLSMRAFYTGSFIGLLNPFALLCGLVSVSMLIMHGGLYLAVKTESPIQQRAVRASRYAGLLFIILFAAAGMWVAWGIKGYVVSQAIAHDGFSNPLHKVVTLQIGAWLDNYRHNHNLMVVPTLAFAGAFFSMVFAGFGKYKTALVSSAFSLMGVIGTVGVSMFPFMLPSSIQPGSSLLVWDASSSQLTLFVMFCVTVFFIPIILAYTTWVYRVMRGKVTAEVLAEHKGAAY